MTKGRAKMAISEGVSVWVLEAPLGFGDASFHAHHAIQITAGFSGKLKLTTSETSLEAEVVAVRADERHRLDGQGLMVFVFVEPESAAGHELTRRLFSKDSVAAVTDPQILGSLRQLAQTFESEFTNEQLLDVGREVVEYLTPANLERSADPRVQKIIGYAVSHLDEQQLSLANAAEGIYLSHSRLRHLFVEQTGLAFRTYVLWLRLIRAVQIYSEGASLTEAAHSAGFSDSAHFSRIFRRTFGLPATTLTRV